MLIASFERFQFELSESRSILPWNWNDSTKSQYRHSLWFFVRSKEKKKKMRLKRENVSMTSPT